MIPQRVLVLGASGYIGRYLISRLNQQDHPFTLPPRGA